MRSSRISTAVLCLAVVSLLGPASSAACLVCDEVVELDSRRADCFRHDYSRFLEKAQRSKTKNAEIDLSACAGDDGSERRGLDKFPDILGRNDTAASADELRSVYVLDTAGIVCLKRLIDGYKEAIDPKVQFDLIASCGP